MKATTKTCRVYGPRLGFNVSRSLGIGFRVEDVEFKLFPSEHANNLTLRTIYHKPLILNPKPYTLNLNPEPCLGLRVAQTAPLTSS